MANQEHLNILKKGVEVWNKWRKENPDVEIDLSGADISGLKLNGIDLSDANLMSADICCANLFRAKLINARLHFARLNFADLSNTLLIEANLSGADLSNAKLRNAKLSGARLIQANFSNTDISGATLYATTRDDWKIDGIKCDYVFWNKGGEVRYPKNKDFSPGEFEKKYKQLPTIEYYFENVFTPIDAIVINKVVQAINEKHPEFELKLDSFHSRGQSHAVFTLLHKKYADEALREITQRYETQIKVLEGQKDQLMQVISMLSNNQQTELIGLIKQLIELAKKQPNQIENLLIILTNENVDITNITSKGNVAYAKNHGKSVIIKDSKAGVIGDNTELSGGVHSEDINIHAKRDIKDSKLAAGDGNKL